jgi:mannose-6-phosphate isomerase-like protein (cupin superfamily)
MPERTTFVTPNDFRQQLGFVVYPKGGEIARHVHRPLERHIVGTSEVLVVRKGRAEIDIYDDDRTLVATRELREGDIMLMVGGGHGFRVLEDTVFLEVKQGPYTGIDEKERF